MAKLVITSEKSRKESERVTIILPNGESITLFLADDNEVKVHASTRLNLSLYGSASVGLCVGKKN